MPGSIDKEFDMPPIAAIAASWIGTQVAAYIGLTGLAASIVGGVIAMGVNSIASSLFGFNEPPKNSGSSNININSTGAVNAIPVIYGQRRVGGTRVFIDTTNDNKNLHLVFAMAEGQVAGITWIYINSEPAALYDPTSAYNGAYKNELGTPDTAGFRYRSKFTGKLTARWRDGSDTQDAITYLTTALPSKWTTDHKCSGVAILYVELIYNTEVYANGLPQITADLKGKKVVDTWDGTWTSTDYDNPAWVLFDYLTNTRYGKGIDKNMLDKDSFIATKNYCNELVTMTTKKNATGTSGTNTLTVSSSSTGLAAGQTLQVISGTGIPSNTKITAVTDVYNSTTKIVDTTLTLDKTLTANYSGEFEVNISQKRYIANGHIDTAKTIIDNVKDILTSMNAFMVQSGGKYRVRCNKEETTPAQFEFNEDNITGSWDIQLGSKTNRFNQVKITYFEPENNYQGNIFLVKDATYLANDNNQVYERELVLPLTCDYARAAYVGRIVMNQSRFQTTISFNAVQTAMVVEVGDVVKVSHPVPGWNNKLFRVMNMTLQPLGDVRIVAVEYDPLVYTNQTVIQYQDFKRQSTFAGGAIGQQAPVTGNVSAPVGPIVETNLSTTVGGATTNKQISWTRSPDSDISYYEITVNGSSVYTTPNTVYVYPTPTPNTDTYAVRAVNTLGYKSSAITG